MFTVRRSEDVEDAPVEVAELVSLAELCGEGFGYDGGPYVRTPRDAVDALAARLNGEVMLDDIGRRCVSRKVARRLFADRAAAEVRWREAQERQDAGYAAREAANPVWPGIPADQIPDGVAPALAMLTAAKDAGPRRQSVLEHALANEGGVIEYIPVEQP